MIGIFDSGIGGVTIFKKILHQLPNYKYIYYSDSKNNPYGDKTQEEIICICKNIIDILIKKGCMIIIIACNTATSNAIDILRKIYNIPIIGTVPPIKLLYNEKNYDETLIMATEGTIKSKKFLDLYNKYGNINMHILSCSGLADLIEDNDQKNINIYLKKKLKNYKFIKNIVLGCTHYPLIKKNINELLGPVKFYENSDGVTKELIKVIKINNIKETENKIIFIDSNNSKVKEDRFFEIIKN